VWDLELRATPMLLKKVKKTILDHGLFDKKEKILVAYSGGVDSTALLHFLLELREEWSIGIFLGHFNHMLRQNAEEDERFVRDAAREHSLPLHVGRADVRAEAEAMKLNIEETGRQLRYEYLKRKAEEIGGARVATGHTLTDQAETFLMRLMRGSGLRGLAGIFPLVDGVIVRPLLEIEREKKKSRSASLELDSLSSVPRALARRVVRNFIVELRGSLRRISFDDVESVFTLAEGKEYSLKTRKLRLSMSTNGTGEESLRSESQD
jgi:tRNA(Ile)-lysidine synthase